MSCQAFEVGVKTQSNSNPVRHNAPLLCTLNRSKKTFSIIFFIIIFKNLLFRSLDQKMSKIMTRIHPAPL